jgi:hypothetical protein
MTDTLEKLKEDEQRLDNAAKTPAVSFGRTRTWVQLECPNGTVKVRKGCRC